jgi:hypothetical protein
MSIAKTKGGKIDSGFLFIQEDAMEIATAEQARRIRELNDAFPGRSESTTSSGLSQGVRSAG